MTAATPAFDRIPPRWGNPLTEKDYDVLAASWITREIADAALLCRVDSPEGREIVGQKGTRDCAGTLFPNYRPGEQFPVDYRIRRDNPDVVPGPDGNVKLERKYLGAPGSGNHLYFPPGITLEQLADVGLPIAVVEGEKKALALRRLADHESDHLRFVPFAITGVWNWLGRIGKTAGNNGERLDVRGPISDLYRIGWTSRTVYIIFDRNVHTNKSVQDARKGLNRLLLQLGATVRVVTLPEECGVNGVDDLLATWGPVRVLELIEQAPEGGRMCVVPSPQFETGPDGMHRVTQQGDQLRRTKLTNYTASVKVNILLDDGIDGRREFEIRAELFGRSFDFTVSAAEFLSMDWPIAQMGALAITYPNQREYARTAIQSLSMTAEDRQIYTHTGWRKVDGLWRYFHAGGAIGHAGAVRDISVRLSGRMSLFDLDTRHQPDTLAASIKASLRLCEVGPASICFPLLATTYRAVLGDPDFSMHLAGPTGTYKTELAALFQRHFGETMDCLHLPGSWSSTPNSLESLAFQAKDTLLVIDDFAPQGSATDVQRYHATADRVFRAVGNHAGRLRMDSSTRLREPKPPRCLVLSTGEEIPRGQSVRARLLILELAKGGVNLGALTACQKDAADGRYVVAMYGFVRWIAGRYDELQSALIMRVDELRVQSLENAAHARTPGIVANLQAGFEVFLQYAHESGALDDAELQSLQGRCWEALEIAAAEQGRHQTATEPVVRYLSLLRALLSSGRAHLASRRGAQPDRNPEACGWRCSTSGNWERLGDCIGWVEHEDVYLEPAAAYRLVQIAGRDRGETLEISEQTMSKRLNERKLLVTVDTGRETLTIRKTICSCSKSVLHLSRATILPEAADDNEEN